MRAERLAAMLTDGVAFDCETHRIQPGLLAPPLVCASVAAWDPVGNRPKGRLLDVPAARRCWRDLLESDRTIITANGCYDVLVMAVDAAVHLREDLMPLTFAAYEAGRIYDLQLAEALHAIANGHFRLDPRTGKKLRDPITKKQGAYSLSICLDLVLGRSDAKANDRFRQSYALLEGVPIEQWPDDARVYPVDDACNTLEIALAQAGLIPRPAPHQWPDRGAQVCQGCGTAIKISELSAPCPRARPTRSDNLHDVSRQAYAALAMHLGAAWGFTVDPVAVEALEQRVTSAHAVALPGLVEQGLLRWEKQKGARGCANCAGSGRVPLESQPGKMTGCPACQKPVRCTGVIKREIALAYNCRGACAACGGGGKVPSARTQKPVGCRACDSTGLDLGSAPVPRTKGSKCRTCRGTRLLNLGTRARPSDQTIACTQCAGQEDVIPGCQTSRDSLAESGAERLINFASFLEDQKLLTVYLPFLKRGIAEVPDEEDDDQEDDDA